MISSLNKLIEPILALPRIAKRIILLTVDISICLLSLWLALYLRLGEFVALTGHALMAGLTSVALGLPIFAAFGLYRAIFRYTGWPALGTVSKAVGTYGVLYVSIFTAVGVSDVPRTVGIIQPIILLLLLGASRALAHIWLGDRYRSIIRHTARPKVIIYGAGTSGLQLATALSNSPEMQIAGFVDDDERLHKHVLNGHPVYSPSELSNLVHTVGVTTVLLAMPGIERKRRNEILARIRGVHVAVRTLPSASELAQGRTNFSDLRELDIDDLLGREPVSPNYILLSKNIAGKVVMVTGAGGFIGSELCKQIVSVGPEKLLLIEQNEYALHKVHHKLESMLDGRDLALVPLLASIQDEERLHDIMSTWSPDTIYHAAAYNHVPLVEHNPTEGVKNNVLGTLKTAQAAINNGVSDFVLISTDKAIRPNNIMGASKRLAEMVLQALAIHQDDTKFSTVRFNNVLGLSNLVVPKFRQQIRDGGPIALPHPEFARHFMTIPEAIQLAIQAGAAARTGDVLMFDMGKPVTLMTLARHMIELAGLTVRDVANPKGDIEIAIVGLRADEKLYEEPTSGEVSVATSHPQIRKSKEDLIAWDELSEKIQALQIALNVNDAGIVRRMMKELVPSYTPDGNIVDWVYLEQEAEAEMLGMNT